MITRAQVQTAVQVVFPPRCVGCGVLVETDFQLCGRCWSETPFVAGLSCDACGVPLPGEESDVPEFCDDCLTTPHPWQKGRAALLYEGRGRQLVLRLKHGDRHDIVHPAARWMAERARGLMANDTVIAPVPLHWRRFLKRRFNQSALLAQAMAQHLRADYIPDLLLRIRATPSLDGKGREERHRTLADTIAINPKFQSQICDRSVLLVDDVMTSGATFAAASCACLGAAARQVNVIALARVAKLP